MWLDGGENHMWIRVVTLGFVIGLSIQTQAFADESAIMARMGASGDRAATARGHYARSHAMLLEALREFDKGKKLASPEVILNSKEWRGTLISRAEELEKLMDPQPRVSKGGARYEGDSRLLKQTDRK